jgi:hypothetical protein
MITATQMMRTILTELGLEPRKLTARRTSTS